MTSCISMTDSPSQPLVCSGLDLQSHVLLKVLFATESCRECVHHLPTCSVREHNEALFISSLHKGHTSVLLPVPHCLLKDSSLGSWKRNQEEQTVKAWLLRKSLTDFIWIWEQSTFQTANLMPVDTSWTLGLPAIALLTFLYHLFFPCAWWIYCFN